MKLIALSLGFAYLLFAIFVVYHTRKLLLFESSDKHELAIQISLAFSSLTIPVSIYHSFDHLLNFKFPKLQAQIIRIIWMVPVYSLESVLSIKYNKYGFIFQSFREIYESYVIYCFMRFLLYHLGDEKRISDKLVKKPSTIGQHKPPFCCLSPWQMGQQFLLGCKIGVLQYVCIRFSLAVLTLFLYPFGWYVEGEYSLKSSYFWMTIINCYSQMYALYVLLMFYYALHVELADIRPFEKFLCIKLVIFFSWWQGIIIGFLVILGHINGISDSNSEDTHSAQVYILAWQ